MAIDSMSIAHTEQITVLHHEIFYYYVGILIDFIFFVNGKSLPVAEGIL